MAEPPKATVLAIEKEIAQVRVLLSEVFAVGRSLSFNSGVLVEGAQSDRGWGERQSDRNIGRRTA